MCKLLFFKYRQVYLYTRSLWHPRKFVGVIFSIFTFCQCEGFDKVLCCTSKLLYYYSNITIKLLYQKCFKASIACWSLIQPGGVYHILPSYTLHDNINDNNNYRGIINFSTTCKPGPLPSIISFHMSWEILVYNYLDCKHYWYALNWPKFWAFWLALTTHKLAHVWYIKI